MSAIDLVKSFSKAQLGIVALTAAIAAAAGGVVGAKLAIDRLSEKLMLEADEALQKELESAKKHYQRLNKEGSFQTPEEAFTALHPELEQAAKALMEYKGSAPKPDPDLQEVSKNVFTDMAYVQEPFDYDAELKRRDPDRPYLITEEEYLEAAPQFDQVEFTYYEGDGILANQQDDTIDLIDVVVGSDNLMRFGHGSNDENIVYVRNVGLTMDIEISKSPGKYSVEVGGFEDETELKHSASIRPRRFRDRDE